MAQRLIVEGNDAIALALLCQKSGLMPPLGYEQPAKFKGEFVSVAGSDTNVLKHLRLSLTEPALSNIGVIIDANDYGPGARWQSIRAILAEKYDPATLLSADDQAGPKIIVEADMPKIGVWIMPDNANSGYLEHFLSMLVPSGNALWQYDETVVYDLMTKPFNELTPARRQKALLYTWLAWQREPGKPFGLAIQAGYLDHAAPVVQPFLQWFAQTFQLA